jgi:hypothetical protein
MADENQELVRESFLRLRIVAVNGVFAVIAILLFLFGILFFILGYPWIGLGTIASGGYVSWLVYQARTENTSTDIAQSAAVRASADISPEAASRTIRPLQPGEPQRGFPSRLAAFGDSPEMSVKPQSGKVVTTQRQFVGATLALIFGVLIFFTAGASASRPDATGSELAGFVAGPTMILGSLAYSSRKRRLLGLVPQSLIRPILETGALLVIAAVVLLQRDLLLHIHDEPFQNVVIPLWAVIAYFCAGPSRLHDIPR